MSTADQKDECAARGFAYHALVAASKFKELGFNETSAALISIVQQDTDQTATKKNSTG